MGEDGLDNDEETRKGKRLLLNLTLERRTLPFCSSLFDHHTEKRECMLYVVSQVLNDN